MLYKVYHIPNANLMTVVSCSSDSVTHLCFNDIIHSRDNVKWQILRIQCRKIHLKLLQNNLK